jgi:hypothetical protein
MYSVGMRVRIEQLWKDGRQRDGRERSMTREAVIGFLFVESQEGERFATVAQADEGASTRVELLPRLWSPTVLKMNGTSFLLRGFQRDGGRLCHQEWECWVLNRQG